MMTRTCLYLVVLCLLACVICAPALAGKRTVELDPTKWVDIDGICTYDRGADWTLESDGVDIEELTGCKPPVGSDPRVRQTIRNYTDSDIWTDWHVTITNGKNLRDIIVYKVGQGTLWQFETYTNPLGFFAHVTSAGPGNPMAVNPQESLYVEFTYDVDVIGQTVTVTQYPTTWYPIPEPSSMMALLAGLGSVVAFRRMRK